MSNTVVKLLSQIIVVNFIFNDNAFKSHMKAKYLCYVVLPFE